MRSALSHAWRAALARPAYSLTVILSLAIGIGVNALIFAVVDGAILRPLPFPDLHRFVGIGADYPRLNQPLEFFEALSGPEYVDIKGSVPSLEQVSGFDLGNEAVAVADQVERVFTAFTWDDPFGVLRVGPERGRGFEPSELATAARVAVISYAYWQTRFAASDGAIGAVIRVAGQPYTIVGVLPRRATLYGTDLWIPFTERPATMARNRRQFNVVARARDGASLDRVDAELEALARRIETAHGAAFPEYVGWRLRAARWTRVDRWPFEQSTLIVFAAAALLLLLVCANLASLTLARAGSRRREFAIRTALGAGRWRLGRQMLAEAALLAAIGAALGLAVAAAGARALPAWLPASMVPWEDALPLDWRLAAFIAAAGVFAAVVVAAAAAIHAARSNVRDILARQAASLSGMPAAHLQRAIVAIEVTLAVVVAAGAVLLASNVTRLLRVDAGFPVEGLTGLRVTLPLQRYDGDARLRFFESLLERVRALPHVAEATVAMQYPPNVFTTSQFAIEGRDPAGALPTAFHTVTSSRFLETLQVPLVAGRWLDDEAGLAAQMEAVINETAAARYFPEGAVGHRIRIAGPGGHPGWIQIVGVTAAVRNRGPAAEPQPEIFTSLRQAPERRRSQLFLLVRARRSGQQTAAPVAASIRTVVRALDPELPVYGVSAVAQNFASALNSRRAASRLLVAFGIVALGLSALGIYGVLSYMVGQRSREIGLRMALGARADNLVGMVAMQALLPVAAGLAVGCASFAVLRKSLAAFLFGVSPEPWAIALVAALTSLIAVLATILPARRALRLDPIQALRDSE